MKHILDRFDRKIEVADAEDVVIIPSRVWKKAEDFINDDDIKPAFFKDFKFIIKPPEKGKENVTDRSCYNSAITSGVSVLAATAALGSFFFSI